jgi:hypothetical protein
MLTLAGPPDSPHPSQCAGSGISHYHPTPADQCRFIHSAIRHPWSLHYRPLPVLYPASALHHCCKAEARVDRVRTIHARQVWTTYQHLCRNLWHIHHHLAAVSTLYAGYGGEHELCESGTFRCASKSHCEDHAADNLFQAGPIMGGILILALLDWCISGRKRFKVPEEKLR